MCSPLLAILRVVLTSGALHSIMGAFLLSLSFGNTKAYFVAVLGQIGITVRSPWPERSL